MSWNPHRLNHTPDQWYAANKHTPARGSALPRPRASSSNDAYAGYQREDLQWAQGADTKHQGPTFARKTLPSKKSRDKLVFEAQRTQKSEDKVNAILNWKDETLFLTTPSLEPGMPHVKMLEDIYPDHFPANKQQERIRKQNDAWKASHEQGRRKEEQELKELQEKGYVSPHPLLPTIEPAAPIPFGGEDPCDAFLVSDDEEYADQKEFDQWVSTGQWPVKDSEDARDGRKDSVMDISRKRQLSPQAEFMSKRQRRHSM